MITAFQIDGSIHCVETSPHATSRPVRAFRQGRIFLTMSRISDASILEANAGTCGCSARKSARTRLLSHSGLEAALVVTRDLPCGVDIEHLR